MLSLISLIDPEGNDKLSEFWYFFLATILISLLLIKMLGTGTFLKSIVLISILLKTTFSSLLFLSKSLPLFPVNKKAAEYVSAFLKSLLRICWPFKKSDL